MNLGWDTKAGVLLNDKWKGVSTLQEAKERGWADKIEHGIIVYPGTEDLNSRKLGKLLFSFGKIVLGQRPINLPLEVKDLHPAPFYAYVPGTSAGMPNTRSAWGEEPATKRNWGK